MIVDKKILDDLTAKARVSPRLRLGLDMRNSPNDNSQRLLNALEPGTVMPIHRHHNSSEVVIIIRGKICWIFYDETGKETENIILDANGPVRMLVAEKGRWHSLECIESGSVIFESKDGPYHPLEEDEILKLLILGNMSVFKDKTLLITGGTGSFGNAVLNRFLRTDIGEIRIFSRDEKKQDDMRHDFQARMPEVANKIKFYIGDVRNKSTLKSAMKGVDYVFHAAALKQVPSCEFFPMEAVKTNVIGTDNTLDVAIDAGVKCVICLSTDKAAYPINAMGITKAIEEKIAVAKSRLSGDTKICCTRYGNVMCSRGSVIPLWIDQIRKGNPITITEPSMTRFIMSLEEAVDLVLFAFENGKNGDILVQKAPACTIQTQAEAVVELFKHQAPSEPEIRVIGIRHGEKMYETLLTREEAAKAIDMGDFYAVPADNRDLNYDKFFKDGDISRAAIDEFNSENTRRLTLEETKNIIASLTYIQNELNGIPNLV